MNSWRLFAVLNGVALLNTLILIILSIDDSIYITAVRLCMVIAYVRLVVHFWNLGSPALPEIVSEKVNWKKEGF